VLELCETGDNSHLAARLGLRYRLAGCRDCSGGRLRSYSRALGDRAQGGFDLGLHHLAEGRAQESLW
jgi:hypothetical protein